ncbi:MAG: hypothetical protein ACRCTZ_03335 [Sarcina sp.]
MESKLDKEIFASKEFLLIEEYELQNTEKNINEIEKCIIEAVIENIKIIDIKEGVSIKGEVFRGKRIIVLTSFNSYTKYSSFECNRIYIHEEKQNEFLYIDCATHIQGIKVEDLYRKEKIYIKIDINKVWYKKNNNKTIEVKILGNLNLYNLLGRE